MSSVALSSTSKRGRPRRFDPVEGIERVHVLFARDGFDAVGVAEICGLLGIAPPSLYAAYGSKRALFQQVLDRYDAASRDRYAAAMDAAEALDELRANVLRTAADLYAADGGVGCLVLSNLSATADPDLRTALADVVAARRGAMTDRARALGASDGEARDFVTGLSVAMMGLSAAARTGMDRAALDVALRQFL
ncbi:TetR/AcrR family transcriptional regulator [Jannaschia sp. LMIT008]|uniref:TetR/AcrR family transcriptional regulator n=1 Tax=Jannaschia maritima TaxID=3032585 RepID=UPI002810D642|nr:TetR/AcrR family transcriptional regulator [Jannaschia sp. LMIT008]